MTGNCYAAYEEKIRLKDTIMQLSGEIIMVHELMYSSQEKLSVYR
jgi:hypothetical protein